MVFFCCVLVVGNAVVGFVEAAGNGGGYGGSCEGTRNEAGCLA